MVITREQLKRAAPIVAVNAVALAAAVELRWPVVALYLLMWAETFVTVVIDALRIAAMPARDPSERYDQAGGAVMWTIIASLFLLGQLWVLVGTFGLKDFQRI